MYIIGLFVVNCWLCWARNRISLLEKIGHDGVWEAKISKIWIKPTFRRSFFTNDN